MKTLKQMLGIGTAIGVLALGNLGCGPEYPDYSRDPSNSANNIPAPYYPTEIARPGDVLSSFDDAFFSTNYVGIGKFAMHPYTLYDPDWIIGQNGFEIYEGHDGGIGDTFEILSKEQGIYACWAFGGFDNAVLYGNWKGRLYETDIRLGDSKNKFLEAYPDAEVLDPNSVESHPYYSEDFLRENVRDNLTSLRTSILVKEQEAQTSRTRTYFDLIADMGNGLIQSIRIGKRWEYDYYDEP